ncbi:M20 family metallopeptidase [Nitriliruptor alkaliphilus]|uniref:M20 family metallopeptidase n=1 Tax=Nitriliruptor alkaliphilus TaxID=427918 RepID=UPI000B2838EF|nr:M20/M25/M40 family metallo-hydrolase [Nitriliruptor alkaliphilus]
MPAPTTPAMDAATRVVYDDDRPVGEVPLTMDELAAAADAGEHALADGVEAFTRWLVGLGQPWCENSLDGPLRPPEESHAAAPLAALLERWGFETRLVGRHATRANVLARMAFGPGPELMLNDHLDTYPSGPASRWQRTPHPYQLTRHGDDLVARGTSDTRANMATLLLAVRDLLRDPPAAGTLLVALTVDEERNGVEGASYLTDVLGLRPDGSITVEPTAMLDTPEPTIGIANRQTGHALLDVTVRGRSSHIWRPDTGINPASALRRILTDLEDPDRDGHEVCPVGLDAGEAGMAQFTPLEATARLAAVGIGPGVSRGHLLDEITAVAARHCVDGLTASVEYVPGPTFVPGTETVPIDDPLVAALTTSYELVTTRPALHYCKPAFNDTIVFRHAGIPAVTFGPGYEGWPVYDEVISLSTMELARDVLVDAVRRFLTPDSGA